MSQLIDRMECRHLNVKDQDTWQIYFGRIGIDNATIAISLNDPNGNPYGKLYLNGFTIESLEKVQSLIEPFIAKMRAKQVAMKEQQRRWESGEEPITDPWHCEY